MKPARFESFSLLIGVLLVSGVSTASAAGQEHRLMASAMKSFTSVQQSRLASIASEAASSTLNAAYKFVTVDAPGEPATNAYGINDTGLASGYFFDANSNLNGFLWRDGRLTVHDYPQAQETALGDSNNAGIVIGNYGGADQHAVLYDAEEATWTPLPDIPNLTINLGDGINNRGVATGVACQGNFLAGIFINCVGWTWNGKAYSIFSAPEADLANGGTTPNGINDRNQVAGYYTDVNFVNHGFIKDGDDFTIVDVAAASNTFVYDINDRGETVGYYADAAGIYHGFVERHGKVTTVDFPGATATFIFGNDARGDLAGAWSDSNHVAHGFVAFKRDSAGSD